MADTISVLEIRECNQIFALECIEKTDEKCRNTNLMIDNIKCTHVHKLNNVNNKTEVG